MSKSFDKTLKQGDRVLFKEMYADRAEFGEIVEVSEDDGDVSYVVMPDNQEWAADQATSWEEPGDDNDAWVIEVSSTCDDDAICPWNGQKGTPLATVGGSPKPEAAPAMPPNPKKLYGAQKPDLSLIPPVAQLHQAMAFENGASKYGAYNWRDLPVEAMTYIAAAKRHLDLFLDGQDYSTDTSPPVHNLGHAMACCAIVLDSQELGCLLDNRPKPGASEAVANRMKAAKAAALAAKLEG